MDALVGVAAGLALSTAAGLRVFVPLMLTSIAARLGSITLTPSMTWIGSDVALIAFATATVLEVAADGARRARAPPSGPAVAMGLQERRRLAAERRCPSREGPSHMGAEFARAVTGEADHGYILQ